MKTERKDYDSWQQEHGKNVYLSAYENGEKMLHKEELPRQGPKNKNQSNNGKMDREAATRRWPGGCRVDEGLTISWTALR